MNQKALKVLEYAKIIDMLSEHATSFTGKKLCSELTPFNKRSQMLDALTNTKDALARVYSFGSISFAAGNDMTMILSALSVKSVLSIKELLAVGSLLTASARVKEYGLNDETVDSLTDMFKLINPLAGLNSEIKRCILSEDEISDDASVALKDIRRQIKITNSKIHESLNSIISQNNSNGYLMDNLVTMRNNRYCIPVKAEHQSKFPGMLHDQSSTGSTVFIEPMAVVKLNNDLSELFLSEAKEIERILKSLSETCANNLEALKDDYEMLSKLDFIFAKALLAKHMKASMPVYGETRAINLKKARHPLIDPAKVVSVDIYYNEGVNLLVITGPNTGGKTVCLKTLGLLSLMGQSGLFIPAFDGSTLTFFEEIYADIGDEQSIEQSLSTFSSHMVNTVSILEHANENSLCLFDELGAGTDPVEGAALATSILSYLHERDVLTMATTHYSEIKLYALETPGVENACCEFDVSTLRPTYRLLIGVPGKSNAFHISKRLGLSTDIIDDAASRVDISEQRFEEVISSLNEEKTKVEEQLASLKARELELEKLNASLMEKQAKLEASRDKILNEANEKASEILSDAKDFADDTIRKYNKWLKDPDSLKDMENRRNDLHGKMKNHSKKSDLDKKSRPTKTHKASEFKLGEAVFVHSMGLKGTVSSLPNAKGDLFVQMGILRSSVNINDLEIIDEASITAPNLTRTGSGKIKMSKVLNISPEINLIGKTVDEAISLLDKYLDDAYLAHLTKVTIIHGRGTGALKNAVSQYLKKCRFVASYSLGDPGQGGYGVTIVEFK